MSSVLKKGKKAISSECEGESNAMSINKINSNFKSQEF